MKTKPQNGAQSAERPPVVAVVGHIDHGKSTLLDYIRHANVTAGEAGGITQHLSAYEATHGAHTITFLDTPGHEAFKAMRSRGLEVADVAILVVSAEDGVKPQTLEAKKLIEDVGISYIVALTKIDKPGVDINRAKNSLLEHGIYLEGMGGEIPWVAVSGKTGAGIPELLDLIILAGQLKGLSTDAGAPATGVVIESHVDRKRGTSATLIVQSGVLRTGTFIVSGVASAPVRIMENFLGKPIKEAPAGTPVSVVGFSALPKAGDAFQVIADKKEAAERVRLALIAEGERVTVKRTSAPTTTQTDEEEKRVIPILIKTDVAGTGEAVLHEIEKIPLPQNVEIKVVGVGVGSVSEADVKLVTGATRGLIVGFNVKTDTAARDLAERDGVVIGIFEVIYNLPEWLASEIETRRPRQRIEEKTGTAKILKVFSVAKGRTVLGGRVEEGEIADRAEVKIMRRDLLLGIGEIVSLQTQKISAKKVEAGSEFGVMVKTDVSVAPGDRLECFTIELK